MITGETGVGIGLIATLVSGLAGVVGLFAVMRYRLARLESKVNGHTKTLRGHGRWIDQRDAFDRGRGAPTYQPAPSSSEPVPIDTMLGRDDDEASG